MDARFVRAVFNFFYIAVILAATLAAIGYANNGQQGFSLGMGCVAAAAFVVRRWLISRMDMLRSTMKATDAGSIAQFRRLHITGIVLNFVLLAVVIGVVTQLPK